MCGRISAYHARRPLRVDRYTVAPGQWIEALPRVAVPGDPLPVMALIQQETADLLPLRWGWPGQRDGESLVFNSRIERLAGREPPGWYARLSREGELWPLVVPVEAFSEKGTTFQNRAEQPWLLAALGHHFPLAGDEAPRLSLLTQPTPERYRSVHHRFPVLLRPETAARWLEQEPNLAALQAFWKERLHG